MIDIQTLSIKDLSKKETLAEIKALVSEYIENNNVDEARDLLVVLQKLLAEKEEFSEDQPDYKQYKNMVVLLKLIVLYTLPEKDVAILLKNSLLLAIQNNIDMADKLDIFLYLHKDNLTGYQSRRSFITAMVENTEKVGEAPLQKESSSITIPPLVGNWLKNFFGSYPSGKELARLEEVEYVNNNVNAKKLSQPDKDLLLKILRVYDHIRFPRLARAAVRETGPVKARTVSPVAREKPTAPAVEPAAGLPADPIALLKQKYQVYRQQREPVLQLEDKILVKTEGDLEAIKKELATASRNNDRNGVVACVKILARQKALASSLKESQSWWQAVADYIEKKYTEQYEPKEIKQAISNLKLEPTTPAILSEFLQYLLKEKLRLSENDSALVGVEIGQLLGGVYQSLAYGNSETGNFEWIKNKIENNKLVSEVG